jgi:hypothetical protein
MMLVRYGLLSSDGPGRSVEATPTDATNLILGFMGGAAATMVADNVTLLRASAPLKNHSATGKAAVRPPIKSLHSLPQDHTLGDALDALIGEWTKGDLCFNDTKKGVDLVEFSITRNAFAWTSNIRSHRGKRQMWEMEYLAVRPEAIGVDPNAPTDEMTAVIEKNGDRKIEETISTITFAVIAELLRG